MKKAITILAVLIVLVGAVFATDPVDPETHTIKIKADVTAIEPIFALKVGATVTNTSDVFGTSNHTVGNTPSNPAGEFTDAVQAQTAQGNLKLDQGGTVEFYAVLQNKAKQIENYILTFGGGTFDVMKNGHAATLGAQIALDSETFASVDGCAVTQNAQNTKAVDVAFDGKKVTAANPQLVLAKATYTYTGDDGIDMLEEGHFYYADVTLQVATN